MYVLCAIVRFVICVVVWMVHYECGWQYERSYKVKMVTKEIDLTYSTVTKAFEVQNVWCVH